MITDRERIRAAIDRVLGEEMYLTITREDVLEVCPEPAIAIHVTARNPCEAVRLLQIEVAAASHLTLDGTVVYLKSAALSGADFQRIESVLPQAGRTKRGMSFRKPEDGEVEVWLFAGTA